MTTRVGQIVITPDGRPALKLESFEWTTAGCRYTFEVTLGYMLAQQQGAEIIDVITEQIVRDCIVPGNFPVKEEYALNRPYQADRILLIAPIEGGFLLIDGYHHVYQAWKRGIAKVPAYLLTPEQVEEIVGTHPVAPQPKAQKESAK